MRKLTLTILLMLLFSFSLAACGGDESAESGSEAAPEPVGDVANGERLFNESTIGAASAPGCATCHALEADVIKVGPSLFGVGVRAETAVAGMSAEDYLRQSIEEPNAHVAEGFVEGIMYQNYAEELTSSQVNDLVAFMLTLK